MKRRLPKKRRLSVQMLETRRVLAASFGWDGPGLGSADLTYHIAGSPSSLSQAETNAAIETAFAAWSDVVDVTFTPTSQSGLRDSIDISFSNIDGPAGTLAQAYFPDDINPARIAGDIQFDLSETWEVGNALGNRAFDLVWVAVHEIGHALGLDHTNDLGSVLAPFVSPSQSFVSLSSVDAAAIQTLYAASDTSVSTPVDETEADEETTDQTPTETGDDPTTTEDPNEDGDSDDNPFPRNRWRRGGRWHRFGGRLDAEFINFNYVNPTDVNGDDQTSALDALIIINQLSRSAMQESDEAASSGLCDANGDGTISALDALTVINAMGLETPTDYVDETDTAEVEEEIDDTIDPDAELDEPDVTEDELDDEVDDGETMIDDGGVIDDTDEQTDDEQTDDEQTDDEQTDDEQTDDEQTEDEQTEDDDSDEVDEEDCQHDGEHGAGRFRLGPLRNLGLFGKDAETLITRFDTNDDASLTEDEVPSRLWDKFAERDVDADADGVVTLAELDASITAARQEAFDAKDEDGDGLLTESELHARFWARISAADIDADGGISFDELETFLAEQNTESPEFHGRPHQHHRPTDAVFAMIGRGIRRR